MHTKNVNHKPQAHAEKTTAHIFVIIMVKFDIPLQKPIGTDQDKTSSIKASYNKGIHTVVIIQLDNLWASAGLDAEGAP